MRSLACDENTVQFASSMRQPVSFDGAEEERKRLRREQLKAKKAALEAADKKEEWRPTQVSARDPASHGDIRAAQERTLPPYPVYRRCFQS